MPLHDLDDIVTLDFESYYAADYSLTLKKYNTSSYVRDPQFKAHCVGICDGRKGAVWYAPEDIGSALRKHAVASRPVCAHNTAFDGLILAERYDIVPPFYYDTMGMTAALHGTAAKHSLDAIATLYDIGGKTGGLLNTKGKRELTEEELELLGEYCCNDTDLCRMVLELQLRWMPEKELRHIDWTLRAFCDPVLYVNQALAKEEYDAQVANKKAKQEAAALTPEILLSDDKLAAALEVLGVDVPLKISPADGTMKPAFSKQDKVFTDLLEHDDERVVALVEARLATKSTIGESRAQRFMEIGDRKLPMAYKYCAAHTTRWGGTNKMNVQNLTRGGRLRRSIVAPPDHVIVVCDSKQIEPRLNNWLWDDHEMLDAFAPGKDPYKAQATRTYGVPEIEINKDQRFVGKVQTIALGYGMGWLKLQATLAAGIMGPALEVDEATARDWVDAYRANSKIPGGWKFLDNVLASMCTDRPGRHKCFEWERGHVWGPSGLALHYPGLRGVETVDRHGHTSFGDFTYIAGKNGKRSKIWGGSFDENWIQYLARCVVADQILLIIDAGRRVVGMSHDEVICVAHKSQADACLDDMMAAMRTVPNYVQGVPLDAEGGYDICYSK
jgi:DNA polymerase family A